MGTCSARPEVHVRGWRCVIDHTGDDDSMPCGLMPRWWNLRERWRLRWGS